ncbi:hypothetical protein [Tessaracoccus sp.]
MTAPDPAPRNAPGRRGIPADKYGGPAAVPSRRSSDDTPSTQADGPRRALASDVEPTRPRVIHRGAWAIGGVGILALVLLVLALQPSSEVPPTTPPRSSTSVTPSPVVTPTGGSDGTPTPAPGTAAPLPGTNTPEELPTPAEEPSPSAGATVALVQLNDAQFSSPEGWTIYGDEMIEGARRTVRLSNPTTDARLQAVTLEGGSSTLADACVSLVNLQQAQFTAVTRQLVVPIGVDVTAGAGVRCGFTGKRNSDGVANTVTFTVVSRATDSHVLMLRTTLPVTVASDAVAPLQLNSMSCQASSSFGVSLPLC